VPAKLLQQQSVSTAAWEETVHRQGTALATALAHHRDRLMTAQAVLTWREPKAALGLVFFYGVAVYVLTSLPARPLVAIYLALSGVLALDLVGFSPATLCGYPPGDAL
jgi:hypothetical protein